MQYDATHNSNNSKNLLVKFGVLALAAASVLFCSGCNSVSMEHDYAKIVSMVPQPEMVSAGKELASAEKAAALDTNAQALYGVGASMNPVYQDGTAVVVKKADYEKLRAGMVVVYWSHRGYRVGHVIIGETAGGYITQGLNCQKEDDDLVTERNYVGIVTRAFAAIDPSRDPARLRALVSNTKKSDPTLGGVLVAGVN